MKTKFSCYVVAPNLSKVQTRVDKPIPSTEYRDAINKALVEVINEQSFAIKAKMLKHLNGKFVAKNDKYAAQLASPLTDFFLVHAGITREEVDAFAPEEVVEESTAETPAVEPTAETPAVEPTAETPAEESTAETPAEESTAERTAETFDD